MPGGGWPGTPEDIAHAVSAVRRDPDLDRPWVLVGHSAGGQLVTWAAAQSWAHGIRGVVSLAGVVDLAHGVENGVGGDAITTFLGGRPADVPACTPRPTPRGSHPAYPRCWCTRATTTSCRSS